MEMIRTKAETEHFVIMAMRDGRLKYVSNKYNSFTDYGYTVKINGAKKYKTRAQAEKEMERFGIDGQIGHIRISYELVETY